MKEKEDNNGKLKRKQYEKEMDRLQVELDRSRIEGQLDYTWADGDRPAARVDVLLTTRVVDLQLLALIGPGVEQLMQQIAENPRPIGAQDADTATTPTTPTTRTAPAVPNVPNVPNQIPRAEPARG